MSTDTFVLQLDSSIAVADPTTRYAVFADGPRGPSVPAGVPSMQSYEIVLPTSQVVGGFVTVVLDREEGAIETDAFVSGQRGAMQVLGRKGPVHIRRHAPGHRAPSYHDARRLWCGITRVGRRNPSSPTDPRTNPDDGVGATARSCSAAFSTASLHENVREIVEAYCIEHCLKHSARTISSTFDVIQRTIDGVNDRRFNAGLPPHRRPSYEMVRRHIRRIEGPLREWSATYARDETRPLN